MISKILKIFLLIFFWFIILLLETSLLNSFNLMLLLVIIINLIEDPESNLGIVSAFLAGILIDFNTTTYEFGIFSLSFVIFSLSVKIILIKFLKIPYVSWLPKI